MTKCPYTPPHPWNLDFPHLMLRAKAIKHKKGEVQAKREAAGQHRRARPVRRHPHRGRHRQPRERTKFDARSLMDSQLGVHPDAWMPGMAPQRFRWGRAMNNPYHTVVNGQRTPGKVAIFSTCYVNYNEPGIGADLVKLLDHNEIPYEIVEKEQCCGMPKLELGDLQAVADAKAANIPVLAKYAREGWAIVTRCPAAR
jgi:glycerol-3-phosphate dehydrogenase subunit C